VSPNLLNTSLSRAGIYFFFRRFFSLSRSPLFHHYSPLQNLLSGGRGFLGGGGWCPPLLFFLAVTLPVPIISSLACASGSVSRELPPFIHLPRPNPLPSPLPPEPLCPAPSFVLVPPSIGPDTIPQRLLWTRALQGPLPSNSFSSTSPLDCYPLRTDTSRNPRGPFTPTASFPPIFSLFICVFRKKNFALCHLLLPFCDFSSYQTR